MSWPSHPRVLELNAWTWLESLSDRHGRPLSFGDVADSALESETRFFDALWLMGVWERSPRSRQIALGDADLREEYRRALPDFRPSDVVGSPFSVRRYRVDARLGGPSGLQALRARLSERGVRLILDFVPNHVAVDHVWTETEAPLLVRGEIEDLAKRPDEFFSVGHRVYAHGRDPYFPPWTDTAQVNAFSAAARGAMADTLLRIAEQCDGVRCDMAMLVVNEVYSRTWGERAGASPGTELWEELIGPVKDRFPDFKFIAEVYWDMEWLLQQQGFDLCYDKRFYDRVVGGSAEEVRAHLSAGVDYQQKLVRFIENHDEARAVVALGSGRDRAAAVLALTLPGAKLVHEGQSRGHRIKIPVQVGRRPREQDDPGTVELYERLLSATLAPQFRHGRWSLLNIETEHPAPSTLIAYRWEAEEGDKLIAVNLGDRTACGTIPLEPVSLEESQFFGDETSGHRLEVGSGGRSLTVDLPPWGSYILTMRR